MNLFSGLVGERLYFKPLCTEDVQAIHAYASDPDVSRYIGWQLKQNQRETFDYIEEMRRREDAKTHQYASIVLKATDEIIGTAMLFNFDNEAKSAEVGYVLHKDYWGMGYCTEVMHLMSAYAFKQLKLHRLHGRVVSSNVGSARVLEKNGFQLEGRLRDHYLIDGIYHDCLIFGKL